DVVEARKVILELLLARHKLECHTCERDGSCKLQDYCYRYGVTDSRYAGQGPHFGMEDPNPFIKRDYDKCIMCTKCVRVCEEITGAQAINIKDRGHHAKIATVFDGKLADSSCVFCGQCVMVCPVGALTSKVSAGKGRAFETKGVLTTCTYCGTGCTFELNVKDDQVVGVTSVRDLAVSPVNKGALCVKGRFGWDFIHSPDRLTTPLIKENGEFRAASWDEALNLAAEKLQGIKDKNGADSLAVFSSARVTNEENYLAQKFARAVLGTNNVDHCARLCHASSVAGIGAAFGSGAMTNSIIDFAEQSKCIFVIGSNTTENHPVIGYKIKQNVRKNGAKLVVADPRCTDLASMADVHMQFRPGTDVALMNGMMNVIIAEDLLDKEFIANRTENFEALKQVLVKYTPEYVEPITGVPAEDIKKAARIYAESGASAICYSMGITQHSTGTDNVKTCCNLAMITGNVGRPGTGVNALRGQNNVQGACDMGALPVVYPAYQSVTNDEVREKYEKAWGRPLSSKIGLTVTQTIPAALTGQIKGLLVLGENPMVSDPDITHVEEALEKLECLIVQDIFLTQTAQKADIVFPGLSFAEKDGTFTSTERRVQLVRRAVSGPGQARDDWQILCELASRMGYPMSYANPEGIFEEMRTLTPSYAGMSYNRLEGVGLHWPCPAEDHPGTPILHTVKFTRGLGLFHAVEFIEPVELPDQDYPFILSTGRSLYHYHTGTMTRRASGLNAHMPENVVQINPVKAAQMGISDGELVRVSTRRGSIELKAQLTDIVKENVIFTYFHFAEAAANRLTNAEALDPICGIPEFKVSAANLEKI
ncbi:MAG: formate dehydrogenase subunit alpha, partial [Syntrophomonadaceae bacterium]|nr:formate dehydrogenase subunit alpha [Syntrophomonadaceae bacterium]